MDSSFSLFLFRALLLFILVGERSLVIEIFSISDEITLARGATTLDSYVVWFGDFFFGVDLSEARPTTKDQLYSWVHSAAYLAFSCLVALVLERNRSSQSSSSSKRRIMDSFTHACRFLHVRVWLC